MKKEKNAEQESHLGKRLLFVEVFANRDIGKYTRYINSIIPVIEEFNALGLSPLTSERMGMFYTGDYSFYINEFREKVQAEMSSVSLHLRPGFKAQTEKHIEHIKDALNKIQHLTKVYIEEMDCPIVDGLPTLTDDFIEKIKDKYSTTIKTEEGSRFYDAFLACQKAMMNVVEMGYNPAIYFDFDAGTGLYLINFIE